MNEQPAWAFRDVAPDQQHKDAEDGTQAEGEPPPHVGREVRGVQQDQRSGCSSGRTQPIGAVDDQVNTAAHAGGYQFVDRRVDRGVLSPDAGAGEETRNEEIPRCEGKCGGHGGRQVHREGQQKQVAPPEAVGEVAEEQCPQAGPGDVERCRHADLCGRQVDAAAVLGQPRRNVADHGDFEPVEDPHAAKPDHDAPVESSPRQPVQPCGYVRRDGPGLRACAHR